MPYISVKTTAEISPEKEIVLKTKLGKAIECIPGKDESWLMINFVDKQRMWFRGDDTEGAAYIEVSVFGHAEPEYYNKMTAVLCKIFEDELSLSQDSVYVKYEESKLWGWNGSNF